MATPRLIYLSPRLLRATESSTGTSVRTSRRAAFSSSSRRKHPEAVSNRYGTANEPPAHLGGGRAIPLSPPIDTKETSAKRLPEPPGSERKQASAETSKAASRKSPTDLEQEGQGSQDNGKTPRSISTKGTASPSASASDSDLPYDPTAARADDASALTNILQMQAPTTTASDTAPPHLQAPRHVHHFDTHTLVRSLLDSKAFTESQAITVMKALRVILTDNIHLARAGLMSRSDAEMDAYQFRAASSELRTETRQRRDAAAERMRADRSLLQHEVEILGQRMTQESLNLKDELKGMFDDRKMAVRTERRVLDNRIQELGYKITVTMNSSMRSEIEKLRFEVTRNAALTLAAFVFGSLGALYMASRRKQMNERAERERIEREKLEKKLRESGQLRVQEPGDQEALVRRVEQGGDPSLRNGR